MNTIWIITFYLMTTVNGAPVQSPAGQENHYYTAETQCNTTADAYNREYLNKITPTNLDFKIAVCKPVEITSTVWDD